MNLRNTLQLTAATCTFVLMLSACSPSAGVLSLGPGDTDQPACSDFSPIAVESLTTDRTDCDARNAMLVFPDGAELETSDTAATGSLSSSTSPYEYGWVSVGDYGIVAVRNTPTCDEKETWGSPEALERVTDAFGETWPCAAES